MPHSLFIYWKVEREALAAAAGRMAAFQRELCRRHAGLVARLYRRADAGSELATLMETYALPGGIGPGLRQHIVADGELASAGVRRGERHVEVFEDWPG